MENESEKELTVAESIDTEEESVEESGEVEFSDTEESSDENEANEEENSNEEADTENAQDEDNSTEDNPKEQSKEERAIYAKARRTVEKSVEKKHKEALDRAYQRGRLEAYKGKINPYTNTEIKDLTDIEVYEDMYKIAQNQGDPIKDYASYVADKKREEARVQKEQEEREQKAQQEIDEFSKKYPDVNISDLFKDEMFIDYAEGKSKTLVDTYESYTKFKNSFRNKGIETAKKTIANNISSPGSLGASADSVVDYENMSREQFLKEVEKVKDGE